MAVGAGVSCGTCLPCRSGRTNMCRSYWTVGLHAHGGLAELAVVPASCTLALNGFDLTPDLAALAQPMSIAVHATRRGRLEKDDQVIVLGAGGIGSFIIYAAARSGATVTAVDLDPAKLAVASRLGASHTLDATTPEFEQALLDAEDPTLVFECTGRPESLIRGLALVADNGRVVVLGLQPQPVAIDFREVSMAEQEIIGIMAHIFATDFPRAAELIASDTAAWTVVAPNVFPLEQIVEVGLIPMARGQSPQIKVLFDPSRDTPRPLRTQLP